MFDRPNGNAFAKIKTADKTNSKLLVHLIGPTSHGYSLIAFQDAADEFAPYVEASVIGWVKSTNLHKTSAHDKPTVGRGGGGFGKRGRFVDSSKPSIELPRGTLLTNPKSGDVIGVVTAAARFAYEGATSGTAAPVLVSAWDGAVVVKPIVPL